MKICPKCKNDDVSMIIYGLPNMDFLKRNYGDRYALGGCCVDKNSKQWQCGKCDYNWN